MTPTVHSTAILPIEKEIEAFRHLYDQGIQSMVQAGKLLAEMSDRDPNLFDKLVKRFPDLTYERLQLLVEVGLGNVNPQHLINSSYVSHKLLQMPPKVQREIESHPVPVLTHREDAFFVEHKNMDDLSRREVDLVFDTASGQIRPLDEQQAILSDRKKKQDQRYAFDGDSIVFYGRCWFSLPELEDLTEQLKERAAQDLAEKKVV